MKTANSRKILLLAVAGTLFACQSQVRGAEIYSDANDGFLEARGANTTDLPPISPWPVVHPDTFGNFAANTGEWFNGSNPGSTDNFGLTTTVLPFQLPNLGAVADPFVSADLGVMVFEIGTGPTTTDVDLYAVRVDADPAILVTDWYNGAALDSNATLIQESFLTPSSPAGFVGAPNNNTDATGDANLLGYLNTAYDGGAGADQYVFLRLSYGADEFATVFDAYKITVREAGQQGEWPVITYTTNAVPGDTDNSGAVEFEADFGPIRDNWLKTVIDPPGRPVSRTDGDLNSDGLVGLADFREWKDACTANGCAAPQKLPRRLPRSRFPNRAVWYWRPWQRLDWPRDVAAPGEAAPHLFDQIHVFNICKLVAHVRPRVQAAKFRGKATMKSTTRSIVALVAACLCLGSAATTLAQDNGWTGGVGNWTDSTWQFGGPPAPSLDARAIVGSTAGSSSPVGEVSVTTAVVSPTLVLGDGADTSGTLNVTSSGGLSVVTGAAGSTGIISVGLGGGLGILNVEGALSAEVALESRNSADPASTITLSGSANVTAVDGFLDRQLVIDGSNVTATFSNNLVLGSDGMHAWRIPASGASTVLVGGNADIGGTLKVEFPDGAPAIGSSWNLIDSATVDAGESPPSGFGTIDQSAVTGLGPGTKFAVKAVADAGSTNGVFTRLTLEEHPVLVIDQQTGAASIRNFNGSTPTVDWDVYVVGSPGGNLNPAAWDRIAPANGWVETSPSSQVLSELNPTSSESLAASSSVSLGTPFKAPSVFGEDNEDITFQFAKPDESTFTQGTVLYSGIPNSTLTLNVDPATGEAQIVNGTAFDVSIESYVISSESMSLDESPGAWESLEDVGATGGNWYEANASAGQLSELLVLGGMAVPAQSVISLGSPYDNVTGTQDLVFQFALFGADKGDFNEDGNRDGLDFLEWQRGNSPTSSLSAADLSDWEAGFGTPVIAGAEDLLPGKVVYDTLVNLGSGSLAAVPEPGGMGLTCACLSLVLSRRRTPRSTKN